MIYTKRQEVVSRLRKLHLEATGLVTQLIHEYVYNKDISDDKLIKIHQIVTKITSKHNTRFYCDNTDTILQLLEDRNFNRKSIDRMLTLITTLSSNNFRILSEEELTFFFEQMERYQYTPKKIYYIINGAKYKYILSSEYNKNKRANLIELFEKVAFEKNSNFYTKLFHKIHTFKKTLNENFIKYDEETLNKIFI